jgi:hypothetical protein
MVSNVWVHFEPAEFVRGDEIIAVSVRSIADGSCEVSLTQVRPVNKYADNRPETVTWGTLPDGPTADAAVPALLGALAGTAAGVVVLGKDHRVRVVPFDELAGR